MDESSLSTNSSDRQVEETHGFFGAIAGGATPWQGIAQGAALLVTSNTAGQVLAAVTGLIIIRSTDQTGYGHYATALAFALAFGGFFLMGLGPIVTREIARTPPSGSDILYAAVAVTLAWSPLALGAIWTIAKMLGYPKETEALIRLTLVIAWSSMVTNLLRAALRGFNRMDLDSLTRVVQGAAGLAFVSIALISFGTVLSATVAMLTATLLTLGLSAMLVSRLVQRPFSYYDSDLARQLLKAALPIGIALVLQGLYWRADTLVLSVLGSVEQVGLYTAARNTVMLSYGVSLAIISAFFPTLSALSGDRVRFGTVVETGLRYMSILSLPIGGLIIVLAPQIVRILYGVEFLDAASSLRVLGLMAPLMFVRVFLWGTLVSLDKQKLLVFAVSVGLVGVLFLCMLLVPMLGIIGTALAAVAGEACVVVLLGYSVGRQIGGLRPISTVGSPLLATAILACFIWRLQPYLSLWWLVPVGAGVYLLTLIGTRGIRPEELSSALHGLRGICSRVLVLR